MSLLNEVINELGNKKTGKGIRVTRLTEREDETKDLELIADLRRCMKKIKELIGNIDLRGAEVMSFVDQFELVDEILDELEASEKAEMNR